MNSAQIPSIKNDIPSRAFLNRMTRVESAIFDNLSRKKMQVHGNLTLYDLNYPLPSIFEI